MRISVYGSGYVGLVTAACLADAGHQVMCMDIDKARIDRLSKGQIPIYEPGLEALVKTNVAADRLHFTCAPQEAVAFGVLQFIAVGTPPDEDGSADLQYVLAVAKSIGQHMNDYRVVIDKSTVPVGTAEKVAACIEQCLAERGLELPFDVCSNPEFLKEGAALEDFTRGARIVVGTDSDRVRHLMRECYAPYNRNHDKLIFMDVRSAELTKYAANAMLATKISFMNEMANIAEHLGVDIEQVRLGIGSDPRIGYHFIYPGCGYGGSCFPKDVKALAQTAQRSGYRAELLEVVERVNEVQKTRLMSKLREIFAGNLRGLCIAVWGLSFKPNTDDVREAPSRVLLEALWAEGAKVKAYDPEAAEEIHRVYGARDDLELVATKEQAIGAADALVICTEWKEFRAVDFTQLRNELRRPVVVDGRNLYSPEEASAAGLLYYGIGRGESIKPA